MYTYRILVRVSRNFRNCKYVLTPNKPSRARKFSGAQQLYALPTFRFICKTKSDNVYIY